MVPHMLEYFIPFVGMPRKVTLQLLCFQSLPTSRLSSPYFLGPKKVEEMKKYGQSKRKPPFPLFFSKYIRHRHKKLSLCLYELFSNFHHIFTFRKLQVVEDWAPQLLLNFKFSLLMPVLESFLPLFNRHPANDKIIIFLCKL